MGAHIYLVGFMGSGKSYWGQRLAEHLDRPFFDLDQVIEAGEGESVAAIFSRIGESGFRELERAYLHRLATSPAAVVATGGGAPCFFDNMEWMNSTGTTVYLKTTVETLFNRLRNEQIGRPLLAGLSEVDLLKFIEIKLSLREQWYHQAKIVVEIGDVHDATSFWELLGKSYLRPL